MRHFLLVLNKARTDHNISITDLTGSGRIDIACRFVNSVLFNSYSLRRDVVVHLLFRGPPLEGSLRLEMDSRNIRGIHPGERSIAGYIKKNLKSYDQRKVPANIGVKVVEQSLDDFVKKFEGRRFVLHEEGDGIGSFSFKDSEDVLFVVGDHKGVPQKLLGELVEGSDLTPISLGKNSYQAQQVSSFINIFLDREKD